jgi:hypothetical protein
MLQIKKDVKGSNFKIIVRERRDYIVIMFTIFLVGSFVTSVRVASEITTIPSGPNMGCQHRGGYVVTGLDYLENVISTKHPGVNLTGIRSSGSAFHC